MDPTERRSGDFDVTMNARDDVSLASVSAVAALDENSRVVRRCKRKPTDSNLVPGLDERQACRRPLARACSWVQAVPFAPIGCATGSATKRPHGRRRG